ncbi:MAG: glycosyltransferase family 39 protein [Deltaproteobacteria bacterium]|nr:glycosyltransferase family 39 protein [Deltaproteobacteria bacterium]
MTEAPAAPPVPRVLGMLRAVLRSERTWLALMAAGAVVRTLYVMVWGHPMDHLFSDPMRHWDNGRNFFTPSPMGTADPVVFQFYLHVLQKVTGQNRILVGLATTALSLSLPLAWYLCAREFLQTRVAALRFGAVVALMPTFIFSYGYFMTETLLVPVIGFALWMTFRADRTRSAAAFLGAASLWMLAALTRSIALPFAIICLGWLLRHQWRKVARLVAAGCIWAVGLGFGAWHSEQHFGVYSPFGNFNSVLPIYFLSGERTYKIHFGRDWVYYFSSPSYYISPFDPFRWESSRSNGTYEFTLEKDRHGEDLAQIRSDLLRRNWRQLPMFVWENVIFLAFGHAWPETQRGSVPGVLCLSERWIWAPAILLALAFCAWRLRRDGLQFYPVMVILFVGGLFSAQLAPMEGRYRKPIEPIVLLTLAWAVERWERRGQPPVAAPLEPVPAPQGDPATPPATQPAPPVGDTGT